VRQKIVGFEILLEVRHSYQVNPLPLISQVVEVILIAVAEPYWARLREPVVPAELKYIVSVVMAIVTTWLVMLMKVSAVPRA
jgi:hypothetical protein